MEIKTIDSFSFDECKEYINQNPNAEHINEVKRRLEYLSRNNKSQSDISPNYILWGDFCSKYPTYARKSKFDWKTYRKIICIALFVSGGCFLLPNGENVGGMCFLLFIIVIIFGIPVCAPITTNIFDIEDTDSENKIVRAAVLKMGVYKFSKNKITLKIPISYDKIVHIGDSTYLLELGDKKGLLNILSNPVWLHNMDTCEISWENNIISISKEGQKIKKISTRGFNYEDKEC